MSFLVFIAAAVFLPLLMNALRIASQSLSSMLSITAENRICMFEFSVLMISSTSFLTALNLYVLFSHLSLNAIPPDLLMIS